MEFGSSRSSREDGEEIMDGWMSLRGFWLGGFAEGLAYYNSDIISSTSAVNYFTSSMHQHTTAIFPIPAKGIWDAIFGVPICSSVTADSHLSLRNERIYPSRVKS
jgi:hypothetical protein